MQHVQPTIHIHRSINTVSKAECIYKIENNFKTYAEIENVHTNLSPCECIPKFHLLRPNIQYENHNNKIHIKIFVRQIKSKTSQTNIYELEYNKVIN